MGLYATTLSIRDMRFIIRSEVYADRVVLELFGRNAQTNDPMAQGVWLKRGVHDDCVSLMRKALEILEGWAAHRMSEPDDNGWTLRPLSMREWDREMLDDVEPGLLDGVESPDAG